MVYRTSGYAFIAPFLFLAFNLSRFIQLLSRSLDETDLVNLDVTIYTALPEEIAGSDAELVWMHGDTSRTFALPATDSLGRELIEATEEALEAGIAVCGPGVPFSEIGRTIE